MIIALLALGLMAVIAAAVWLPLIIRLPWFTRTRKPPFVQPHTGKHVASQPRLPQRKPLAGRAPYPVAATGELTVVNDDAETLRLGGWGVIPQREAAEAEQLAEAMLP